MRLAQILVMGTLLLGGTQVAEAAVYRVWIDPNISSHGWTEQQLRAGIQQGLGRWEQICNLRFDYVAHDYQAQILIRSDALYQPDGSPRGGYCKGRTLWLSNGRHEENPLVSFEVFSTQDELSRVVAHEFGHFVGLKHATERQSLMYPSAPSWFSAREIAWARRRFGAPVASLRLDRLPAYRS